MDVPQAEYPQDELLKYNILSSPPTNLKDSVSTPNSNSISPDREVVKISRRRPRTKHKVQTANNNASTRLRRHVSERSWTIRNWYKHIHWKNTLIVIIVPFLGLLLLIFKHIELNRHTLVFASINYLFTLLSVNLLYHRYWSHHSFTINNERVVYGLAALASGGGLTSAKNWCASHRAHHRYCDNTDKDPHNIRRGLLFSHFGWMVLIHNPKIANTIRESKLDDLPNEAVVKWQLENYFSLFILIGLVIPSVVCGWFWNDYWDHIMIPNHQETISC
ncbi:unnamed protein product [Ambrosiozyma monospora]|uniref:Unnamed protein product n=1 Tax=Ambrosiozyma monospora TaxID=43982 RepID=A0ACB5TW00_AMBMO|nr:unnamed protein product [Ambrosiozyma monospora]